MIHITELKRIRLSLRTMTFLRYLQAKYAIFTTSERNISRTICENSVCAKRPFEIAANNSNKMAPFREFLRCVLSVSLRLLLFFTLSNLILPGDWCFRNTEGLFACITKPRERSDGSERKARSFVRTTIRKDKVNISSESVYLPFFLENMLGNIRYFAVMEKMKENNLLFSEHLTSFSYRYHAFKSVSFCFYKYFYYFFKRCKR